MASTQKKQVIGGLWATVAGGHIAVYTSLSFASFAPNIPPLLRTTSRSNLSKPVAECICGIHLFAHAETIQAQEQLFITGGVSPSGALMEDHVSE
eukprot:2917237-Amphidinium_carterae.1